MIVSITTIGTPLRLSIDFTGGSLLEVTFDAEIARRISGRCCPIGGHEAASVKTVGGGRNVVIRTKELSVEEIETLKSDLIAVFGDATVQRSGDSGALAGRRRGPSTPFWRLGLPF